MPDNLSHEQRSKCMSNVRSKDTDLERVVRSELHRRGYRFRKHMRELPGTPDIVFTRAKVAVFVNGDFWHGYRFHQWSSRLAPFWQAKIGKNRARDLDSLLALRRLGWRVIRIWKHEVKKDLAAAVSRITSSVDRRIAKHRTD